MAKSKSYLLIEDDRVIRPPSGAFLPGMACCSVGREGNLAMSDLGNVDHDRWIV